MSFVNSKTTGVFRDISDLDTQVQKRIRIERRIVKMAVKCLITAGYALSLDNGGDTYEIKDSTDRKAVLSLMMETDDEHLYAKKDGKSAAVYFVYGNDGYDVICDYNTSLEAVMKPANDLAEKIADTL